MTRKKIAAFLLLFTLLVMTVGGFMPSGTVVEAKKTIAEVDAEIAEWNARLAELNAKIEDTKNRVAELEKETDITTEYINKCAQLIAYNEVEIETISEQQQNYEFKKASVMGEVMIADGNCGFALEMYEDVLQYNFRLGDVSTLQMLFEAENFTDFLTRVDSANYVMEYGAKLVAEITAQRENLKALSESIDATQSQISSYEQKVEADTEALKKQKEEYAAKASELGIDFNTLVDEMASNNTLISEIKTKIAALKKERQEILDSMSDFLWPIASGVSYRITSPYGGRTDPINGSYAWHNGIDIACSKGSPILASKGGTVTQSALVGSYGNCVIVYHGGGVSTLYAHCSERLVSIGDTVKQGDVIAKVGSTGRSTGPHLHFSIIINGEYVNPKKYLAAGYF